MKKMDLPDAELLSIVVIEEEQCKWGKVHGGLLLKSLIEIN